MASLRPVRTATVVLVAPLLLLTAALVGWTGWYVQRERGDVGRLARQAAAGDGAGRAFGALTGELQYLLALQAFGPQAPPVLRPLESRARPLRDEMTREQLVDGLVVADRGGVVLLDELRGTGAVDAAPVRAALEPLGGADIAALRSGRGRFSVPPRAYADAFADLERRATRSSGDVEAARLALVAAADRPAPWREGTFLALAAVVTLLGLAWCAAAGRWVTRRVGASSAEHERDRRRAEDLARRNGRLLALADVARKVGSEQGEAAVARALAEEAMALVQADFAALLVAEGADVRAAASVGGAAFVPFPATRGTIGRAIDTCSPARAVVDGEPGLPGERAPLGLLIAPLVADRRVIGAIVAGSRHGRLFDDEDELAFRLLALTGATDLAAARVHDSTTDLVMRDALTGLANRRRLEQDLVSVVPATVARGDAVAFAMVDVDHFKAYNDTHGHPAGDTLLRQVAETIAGAIRQGDVAYRFGGEEFCVLLPGATPEEAAAVAERVRAAIEGRRFSGEETQPNGRLTVSMGVAWRRDTDAPTMLAAADAALYEAKRGGRNRVVAAG